MAAAPLRTELADTYPAPSNALFKTGIGALWDFITGLLGTTGAKQDALDALRLLDPDGVYNLSLVPTVGASALTMNVKTRANAVPSATDPVMLSQRSATAGVGDFNLRTITGALALVFTSGSTLGHTSAVQGAIYWYLLDNAGAQELAASSSYFGKSGIVTTTAEGGAGGADSATVMYSATARANVPFRCVGRTFDTQAAAGVWAAVPSEVLLTPEVTPSAFALTLLDDADAAAVRATLLIETKSTVASATTPDIWTGTGHLIDYTGTTTSTGFAAAPQAGASRELLCAGISTFTNGANYVVAGGSFTSAAGDRILVVAETTTKFRLYPLKADGTAVVPTASNTGATTFLAADVTLSATASWFSGPNTGSIGAAGQVWLIMATAVFAHPSGTTRFHARIYNGATADAETGTTNSGNNLENTVTVHKVVTLAAATTFTLQARDSLTTTGTLLTTVVGAIQANQATSITAVRLS